MNVSLSSKTAKLSVSTENALSAASGIKMYNYSQSFKAEVKNDKAELPLVALGLVNGFMVRPGYYNMLGATALTHGVNFTVSSCNATRIELLLFHSKSDKPYGVIPIPEHYKIGHVYSIIVFGLSIDDLEYAYRVDGPYNERQGLIFDRTKILLDPYAKAVSGQSQWGVPGGREFYKARIVGRNFDWGESSYPQIPLSRLVIYEMHTRGFTRHHSSGVESPGTFAGIYEKIPYLKELGVNAIELLPIFEFDELEDIRDVNGQKLYNYWGYNTVSFFAPNTGYASKREENTEGEELKTLIRALHENGIEIILDVVFNHTAEGNEKGRYISFKGFDNNVFYMLTPDGQYYNFSGCGNTVNCNHPIVQDWIIDCLRYWVTEYRIDGFRFDLASILGRNEDGSPMSNPPLLQRLAFDPLLGNVKLIAEAWDAGGLYQVGNFPSWSRWVEWNGKYRDDMRAFLKGDDNMCVAAANRLSGSPDLYDEAYRGKNASVNFLTCHDGFTLHDIYSYNQKHNEANGWDNTDGADDNRSWNCGIEGQTTDGDIVSLRQRMMKNAAVALFTSRGICMFLAGDEFGNSQFGNNNAYCQDNEISWIDWKNLEDNAALFGLFKFLIEFRKNHPVVSERQDEAAFGRPGVSYLADGQWGDRINAHEKVCGVLFTGNDGQRDDAVCVILNSFWEQVEISLPYLDVLGDHNQWLLAADTGSKQCFGMNTKCADRVRLSPRSAMLLFIKTN